MKTDTMRVLAVEELDYIAGGLSVTNFVRSLLAQDICSRSSSDSFGGGINVYLGGAYASVGSRKYSTRTAILG